MAEVAPRGEDHRHAAAVAGVDHLRVALRAAGLDDRLYAGVDHELHFLDTPDEISKAQLKARSADLPAGAKWTTEADFELIASHFRAPGQDERFNVIAHRRG